MARTKATTAAKTATVSAAKAETEKKVETKVEAVVEEEKKRGRKPAAATAKKTTTAKTAKAVKKEITYTPVIEFGDNQYNVNDIVARAEASFKNDNKRKRYDEFSVYIKPEEYKAYYVAKFGDKEYKDSIEL